MMVIPLLIISVTKEGLKFSTSGDTTIAENVVCGQLTKHHCGQA